LIKLHQNIVGVWFLRRRPSSCYCYGICTALFSSMWGRQQL